MEGMFKRLLQLNECDLVKLNIMMDCTCNNRIDLNIGVEGAYGTNCQELTCCVIMFRSSVR
jgi:hypothetical protein